MANKAHRPRGRAANGRRTQQSTYPTSFRMAGGSPTMSRASLALGLSTAMLIPTAAAAAEETEMKPVTVIEKAIDPNPHAEPGVPYKARKSGDERHTRPLAETPQTITVLTQQQLQDTGRSDLREILRAQPGITLGTGENGNAFGDRYIIRGQEARSDTFVDGLRDPGMSVRESFAVDQVEITKGPSSTFAGRGATGGAINAVTKQATTDTDFTKLGVGIGTDNYRRLTVDTNRVLTDDLALRVNLMEAYQAVPDRDPADRARMGAALSLNWRATDKLDVTADYYHLEAKDKPDLGTWLVNGKPKTGIPVYAQNEDFLKSITDTFTLRLGYQANKNVKVTNLTRYGTAYNAYVATGARGTTFGINDPNAGQTTATLSTHQGWQEVDYFANQTNLFVNAELAGMKHEFIFGLEYSDHKVLNGNYVVGNSGQNCRTGTSVTNNAWCIYNGSGDVVSGLNGLMNRRISKGVSDIDWNVKTVSFSVMDTVDITDKWTLFGGLRYDRFDYRNITGTTTKTKWELEDGLWNAHLGLTYKFRPDANVYATYSTASDFNGGESDVTNCDYGGICVPTTGLTTAQRVAMFAKSKPELSENIELGTKWNLMGGKLLATAALFQVTKKDVFEILAGTSYSTAGAMNTGKYRIEGVEFSLAGNLTDKLSAQGGLVVMNAKWLESQNQAKVGQGLSNFPEKSASLLLNYQATPKFSFGGNVTYQSEKYSGTPESPEALNIKVPDYTVYDLFATYKIDRNLKARLNIGNVTNEKYYLAAYRSGAFVYLGDARNVRLTLNYDF